MGRIDDSLPIDLQEYDIKELDMLIERIYEDNVLGKISDERYYRLSANYEQERKGLLAAMEELQTKPLQIA